MPDDSAEPRFSVLSSLDAVDGSLLGDLYAYPEDLRTCWVRANFVSTLDGGAAVEGKSGELGGAGDRALFGALRERCDVVLVGAGTVRTEDYSGVHLGAGQRRNRRTRGQSELPPIAIVTHSGNLDRDLKVFTRTEVRPLVITPESKAGAARDRLAAAADVVACSGKDPDAVDLSVAMAELASRGLLRVLTEGGPSLLGALIEERLLDELCLTLTPAVVGGQTSRIAQGAGDVLTPMRRAQLLGDSDGYLYARYVRDR